MEGLIYPSPDTTGLIGVAEEEDLVNELLDYRSPIFLLPHQPSPEDHSSLHGPQPSRLVPAVYSGPTLGDVETALASTFGRRRKPATADNRLSSLLSPLRVEKKLWDGKKEHRYTITVQSFANGLADDGYKWRKYGQKFIKNRSNPRSYYRCTNPRCNAKKQVERSPESPEVYIITYEGLHLHHAYPSLYGERAPKHLQRETAAAAAAAVRSVEDEGVGRMGLQGGSVEEGNDLSSLIRRRVDNQAHSLLIQTYPSPPLELSSSSSSSPSSMSVSSSLSWSPLPFPFDLELLSATAIL